VKDLPAGLPPANSRKWHSRRWWDGLGYVRVRSLSNPAWNRDVNWLTHVVVREQASAPADEKGPYETILRALRRYPRTASGVHAPDMSWDEVLASIDELSLHRQARHLEQIKAATTDLGEDL
jgi:hypothetical protein